MEGLCQVGWRAGGETAAGGPHQDWLGLQQGPKENGTTRCYRCQGYDHLTESCTDPDTVCWRCGVEGHRAAVCNSTPQCYLCAAKEDKPLNWTSSGDNEMCCVQTGSHKEKALRTYIESNTLTYMSAEAYQETDASRTPRRKWWWSLVGGNPTLSRSADHPECLWKIFHHSSENSTITGIDIQWLFWIQEINYSIFLSLFTKRIRQWI